MWEREIVALGQLCPAAAVGSGGSGAPTTPGASRELLLLTASRRDGAEPLPSFAGAFGAIWAWLSCFPSALWQLQGKNNHEPGSRAGKCGLLAVRGLCRCRSPGWWEAGRRLSFKYQHPCLHSEKDSLGVWREPCSPCSAGGELPSGVSAQLPEGPWGRHPSQPCVARKAPCAARRTLPRVFMGKEGTCRSPVPASASSHGCPGPRPTHPSCGDRA